MKMNLDLEKLKRHHLEPAEWNHGAAVLIPLLSKSESSGNDKNTGSSFDLLFEVRASTIPQGGDICFPGGHIEEGELPEEAAVRETEEELLLNRVNGHRVHVIAPMHILTGPRGIEVSSFLGEIEHYKGTFSRDEIARVFTLPLDWFLEHPPVKGSVTSRTVPDDDFPYDKIPGSRDLIWRDIHRPVYFYDTPEGLIWGLTAEILYNFMLTLKKAQ